MVTYNISSNNFKWKVPIIPLAVWLNANVSSFINFGVVILGLHQKTERGLDMNFLFEITEVTSVELYRNDFGIDTTEGHSAV